MKKNFDKILVLITFSVFILIATSAFWIDIASPKKIDIKNALVFGDKNSKIKLVVFEDFNCKFCKKFSHDFLPQLKNKYIDSNKISYTIVPLSITHGSKPITNAAMIIYEMNKESFFEFLKIISDENFKIESKQELVEIAKNLKGVNIEIFKEFLNKEVFENVLQDNLDRAKKIVKPLQVPSFYLNGSLIKMSHISTKIDELISYGERQNEKNSE
jgi:protein-disulfide isomerase